jgi:hypothetical protein
LSSVYSCFISNNDQDISNVKNVCLNNNDDALRARKQKKNSDLTSVDFSFHTSCKLSVDDFSIISNGQSKFYFLTLVDFSFESFERVVFQRAGPVC